MIVCGLIAHSDVLGRAAVDVDGCSCFRPEGAINTLGPSPVCGRNQVLKHRRVPGWGGYSKCIRALWVCLQQRVNLADWPEPVKSRETISYSAQ